MCTQNLHIVPSVCKNKGHCLWCLAPKISLGTNRKSREIPVLGVYMS